MEGFMARQISARELARQIRREGARHNLEPLVFFDGDDGRNHNTAPRVIVGERHRVLRKTSGGFWAIVETVSGVCSIDAEHPFSAVLRNRKGRQAHEVRRRLETARMLREQRKAAAMVDVDGETREFVSWVLGRGPRVTVPGGDQ